MPRNRRGLYLRPVGENSSPGQEAGGEGVLPHLERFRCGRRSQCSVPPGQVCPEVPMVSPHYRDGLLNVGTVVDVVVCGVARR